MLLAEEKVKEAMRLLAEADRLDLVVSGGVQPHSMRRASSGVATAVIACSLLCTHKGEQERQAGTTGPWGRGATEGGRGVLAEAPQRELVEPIPSAPGSEVPALLQEGPGHNRARLGTKERADQDSPAAPGADRGSNLESRVGQDEVEQEEELVLGEQSPDTIGWEESGDDQEEGSFGAWVARRVGMSRSGGRRKSGVTCGRGARVGKQAKHVCGSASEQAFLE
ncbi:hypothetical protein NDU88_004160 [Pleurodeles waltl]|uniref:Uncharacterized protein n=1 Tax=Pleurodeles waltl TaxID=8319 RepID=A0AAV7L7V0_PLEWA|nr:hypothetical protein NDU88_004160 [Pleurodeles waltl]